MLFQCIEQRGSETEVAFFEVFGIFGTVHACEIEDEVCLGAIAVELLDGGVDVVLEDLLDLQIGEAAVFAVLYGIKLSAKVLTYKTFCAGD